MKIQITQEPDNHISLTMTRDTFDELVKAETIHPELITYEQAAEMWNVSLSLVKKLVAAKMLTPVKIGNAARLRLAEVKKFSLQQHK